MPVNIQTYEAESVGDSRVTHIHHADHDKPLSNSIQSITVESYQAKEGLISPQATLEIAGRSDAQRDSNRQQVKELLEHAGYEVKIERGHVVIKQNTTAMHTMEGGRIPSVEQFTEARLPELIQRLSTDIEVARGQDIHAALNVSTANDITRQHLATSGVKPSEAGLVTLNTDVMDEQRAQGWGLDKPPVTVDAQIPQGPVSAVREDSFPTTANGRNVMGTETNIDMRDTHAAQAVADALRAHGIKPTILRQKDEVQIADRSDANKAKAALEERGLKFQHSLGDSNFRFHTADDAYAATQALTRVNIPAAQNTPQVTVLADASADRVAEALGKSGHIPDYVAKEIVDHTRTARPPEPPLTMRVGDDVVQQAAQRGDPAQRAQQERWQQQQARQQEAIRGSAEGLQPHPHVQQQQSQQKRGPDFSQSPPAVTPEAAVAPPVPPESAPAPVYDPRARATADEVAQLRLNEVAQRAREQGRKLSADAAEGLAPSAAHTVPPPTPAAREAINKVILADGPLTAEGAQILAAAHTPRGAAHAAPAAPQEVPERAPSAPHEPSGRRVAAGVAGIAGVGLMAYGVAEAMHRKKEGQSNLGAVGDMAASMPQGMVISSGLGDLEHKDYARAAASAVTMVASGGLVQGGAWLDTMRGAEKARSIPPAQVNAFLAEFPSDKPIIAHNADPLVERLDTVLRMQREGARSVMMMINPLNADWVVMGKGANVTQATQGDDSLMQDIPIDDAVRGMAALALAKGITKEDVKGAYDTGAFDNKRADALLSLIPDSRGAGYQARAIADGALATLRNRMDAYTYEQGRDADLDRTRWNDMRALAVQYLDGGGAMSAAQRAFAGIDIYAPDVNALRAAGMGTLLGFNGNEAHDVAQTGIGLQTLKIGSAADKNEDGKLSTDEIFENLSDTAKQQVKQAATAMLQVSQTSPTVTASVPSAKGSASPSQRGAG